MALLMGKRMRRTGRGERYPREGNDGKVPRRKAGEGNLGRDSDSKATISLTRDERCNFQRKREGGEGRLGSVLRGKRRSARGRSPNLKKISQATSVQNQKFLRGGGGVKSSTHQEGAGIL